MSNVLSEGKKQQVIALGKLGWPLRRIEQATGVRRETASAYLKAAGVVVRLPRFWGKRIPAKPANEVTPDREAKPAKEVTPDFIAPFSAKPAMRSTCEAYRELIEQGLALGRNSKAIWQDLVSDHGFAGGYQAVKRFVRKLRGPQRPEPAGIILPAPGEEAQVDYGSGPMVRDPQSGKYRRTRLFVLTLGYSRKCVRLLTWRSSVRTWGELHEKAFRRLGGCPTLIVLDNLKEGVAVPDLYDPTVNPLFRDVLTHYGVTALPCRIQDPDRKGKVESGIGYTKRTALKGMRFENLEEAQAYLDRWEERWANTRIHGTTKRQVAAMFLEEKPHLLPQPLEPFRYYQYGERVVHLDGCVEVEAAYYGLPPGWIGRSVKVQWDAWHVRILHPNTNQLLREHLRQKRGGYRIEEEDHPKKMPLSTAQLLRRAAHAGTQTGKFCQLLYDRQAETGIRRILGVLSLIKKYGTAAVEDACAAALDIGVYEYRLRQLRLGGIAAVLETRLQQAHVEPMAPIDFLSCLVSDELTRRGDRLLERRRKQAQFRDPQRTLDNFDFNFNKKMNRSLVFDLATAAFVSRREDALFLGPPGTGKSHLAQAIGQAVIGQGYRVIYREAHILLEEIADAALDGKRKEHMELLATVPLLIIDDLGMRKLGPTAGLTTFGL